MDDKKFQKLTYDNIRFSLNLENSQVFFYKIREFLFFFVLQFIQRENFYKRRWASRPKSLVIKSQKIEKSVNTLPKENVSPLLEAKY